MAIDNVFTIGSALETADNLLKLISKRFQKNYIASPSPISRFEIADLIKIILKDMI